MDPIPLSLNSYPSIERYLSASCESFLIGPTVFNLSVCVCVRERETERVTQLLSHVRFFATSWTIVRLLCPWSSPGKNTGVGSLSLLQGIFLTQGSNPGLLHYRQILYHLSHQEIPIAV